MIRIFISLILYLITMLTNAQSVSDSHTASGTDPIQNIKVPVIKSNTDRESTALYPTDKEVGFADNFGKEQPGLNAISGLYDKNHKEITDFTITDVPEEERSLSICVMNFDLTGFEDAKFEVSDKDLTFEILF